MHLIQILLPLFDNEGQELEAALFQEVRKELVERFGGLTGYTQTPVEGLWKDEPAHTTRDELVIFEVMAKEIDAAWWRSYRESLERRFRQEQVVVRTQQIELL